MGTMTEVGALATEGAVVTVGGVATAVVMTATSGGVVGTSVAEADVVADGALCSTSDDDDGWRLGERTGVPGWESVSEEDEATLSVVGVGAAAVTTLAVAKVVDSLGVDSISGSR